MKGVLLDTNVVSEVARPEPDARVLAFLVTEVDLWLSAIVIHELEYGVRMLPHGKRREQIIITLEALVEQYADRILSVGRREAEHAAIMRTRARSSGRVLDIGDALIAATAAVSGLFIATRNTKDFQALDLEVINPWKHEQ